jgi:hypothetical protein
MSLGLEARLQKMFARNDNFLFLLWQGEGGGGGLPKNHYGQPNVNLTTGAVQNIKKSFFFLVLILMEQR